jgi:hypothetical protein
MNFELRIAPVARRSHLILLPSYITTIYRATTLTGAAHSHKKKLTHALALLRRIPRSLLRG